MSNPVFTSVCLEGERRELKSLYGKMKRLQEREKPLVENGHYDAKRWLGCLATRLGKDYHKVYCRGTWSDLRLYNDHLYLATETAWNPPLELLELIRDCYPSLKYYYAAEGDGWDWYLTNDAEGKYYSSRYVVDMEPDIEYFDTIEEACKHVSAYIGKFIAPTLNALLQAAEDWNDTHPDADWPINIKWYEIG